MVRYRSHQRFQVCGISYRVDVQVHMPLLNTRMFYHTIQVGIEEEGKVHHAVFTTQLGGSVRLRDAPNHW